VFEKSESRCKKSRQRNFIRRDPSAQYRTKVRPQAVKKPLNFATVEKVVEIAVFKSGNLIIWPAKKGVVTS
jgi:hypothetical protein